MKLHIAPETTDFDSRHYTVALRGTALLEGQAVAWCKTRSVWRGSRAVPGADLTLEIPMEPQEDSRGRFFEAAIFWRDSGPGRGLALWSGKYWVRNTGEGPALEEAE